MSLHTWCIDNPNTSFQILFHVEHWGELGHHLRQFVRSFVFEHVLWCLLLELECMDHTGNQSYHICFVFRAEFWVK